MPESLIGQLAPDFQVQAVGLTTNGHSEVSLSAYAQRWLLLLFYPRDFSFVCPTELTAFSAHIDVFRERDCEILGLSVDSVEDHHRWLSTPVEAGGIGPLQFPLGADPDGTVSRAYGVWMEKLHCSARGLFIIDPNGIVQYAVVHNTSVGRSIEETLRVLDAIQSGGLCPASWTNADGTIDVELQMQPGRVLGHFRIAETLGTGSFGTVFAADDLTLDRRVALKIIGRKASIARETVLTEARTAAKLHHRNICTLFAVETLEAVPVIVMEHIDGETLASIDIASLPSESRKQIALGIAEGLAHAHAHGVVHGDIKPANIMISTSGEPKLLDFGLATLTRGVTPTVHVPTENDILLPGHTADATVIGEVQQTSDSPNTARLRGTPAYMSPEQTRGLPATTASDVYAFSLLLVELLTGRTVVPQADLIQTLNQIQSGEVRHSAVVAAPVPFKKMVSASLAEAPDERPKMSDWITWIRQEDFDGAN